MRRLTFSERKYTGRHSCIKGGTSTLTAVAPALNAILDVADLLSPRLRTPCST